MATCRTIAPRRCGSTGRSPRLLSDLKARGLFDSTLIAICTEFGRTPWTDSTGTQGRNHYAKAFTALLAGGGVKGGCAYGQTDEFGINIVADPVHVHDYHATILHLMGIDHTRLVYRYAGRDFRLTDVDGNVIKATLTEWSIVGGPHGGPTSNASTESIGTVRGRLASAKPDLLLHHVGRVVENAGQGPGIELDPQTERT